MHEFLPLCMRMCDSHSMSSIKIHPCHCEVLPHTTSLTMCLNRSPKLKIKRYDKILCLGCNLRSRVWGDAYPLYICFLFHVSVVKCFFFFFLEYYFYAFGGDPPFRRYFWFMCLFIAFRLLVLCYWLCVLPRVLNILQDG